jgi:hypothetical protein
MWFAITLAGRENTKESCHFEPDPEPSLNEQWRSFVAIDTASAGMTSVLFAPDQ